MTMYYIVSKLTINFEQVLRKFQGLVTHFMRWKNVKKNYKRGIEVSTLTCQNKESTSML